MLAKFAVKKYRGFKDRIELDLSRPANYEFNGFAIKNGIIKNGIVYGPNGCGKTNLSLAIFDIVNHLSQKNKKPDYYTNFVYAGSPNKLVDFEYTFMFQETKLNYCYSKDLFGALKKESLYVNEKLIFSLENGALSFGNKDDFQIGEEMKNQLANNANNISIISFLLMSYPLSQDHYLIKLKDFVNSMLWFRSLGVNEYIGLETGSAQLEEFIISNDYLEDFEKFLQNVSEQKFHFINKSKEDKQLICEIEGNPVLFWNMISKGTQSLILLYYWTKKLNNASFVVIDEFDAFYHYKLSVEVCKLLFKNDCQTFMSSHNTYLMTNDLLRPDCNFILNNNKIKALCDCTDKELRFGHNIEKIYRANAFQVD